MLWSEKILEFFKHLNITASLPDDVVALNPYQDKEIFKLCEKFYAEYYSDNTSRTLIIGINPGRLGAGLTGIPFTDPIKLEKIAGIPNHLPKKPELSSNFIYRVIEEWGGAKKFYSQFYFGSVSPLGFTRLGKNLNYYDVPQLQSALMPFIKSCIHKQIGFGLNTEICFVLGEGKNFEFVNKLNQELKLFREVVPLSHPRFIMQYKQKQLNTFVMRYCEVLGKINS